MNAGSTSMEQIKKLNPKTYQTLVKICQDLKIDPKAALSSPQDPAFKAVYAVKDQAIDNQISALRMSMQSLIYKSLGLTFVFLGGRRLLRRFNYVHPLLSKSRKLSVIMISGSILGPTGYFRYALKDRDLMDYYSKRAKLDWDYYRFEKALSYQMKLNYKRTKRSGVEIPNKLQEMMDDDELLDI